MYLPLFFFVGGGGGGGSVFVFVLLCITLCPFYFCNHLKEEEEAGCFAFIALQMFCGASPRCRRLVCSVWHFLIILTYFLYVTMVSKS